MDDKTLLENINNGELSAVRLLVEENKNLVWHIIIAMTGRNSDCEDLFQEVFLRVFKGIKHFRADARLSTWIGSVTHHVCVDYLRKKKREMSFQHDAPDQSTVFKSASDRSWQKTENEDLNKVVLAAIAGLPADFRTVISLYHLDERSYREISEITGMPEGTVKSYISRGRNLLREMLIAQVPDLTEILDDF
ncbi:MAG: RNA polymerase sigma factor [Bacteroidales bacterium]|nr:RNA polymerase sigma factor [Bacteroidales bacterium]